MKRILVALFVLILLAVAHAVGVHHGVRHVIRDVSLQDFLRLKAKHHAEAHSIEVGER